MLIVSVGVSKLGYTGYSQSRSQNQRNLLLGLASATTMLTVIVYRTSGLWRVRKLPQCTGPASSEVNILQGNVATRLMCGGIFNELLLQIS